MQPHKSAGRYAGGKASRNHWCRALPTAYLDIPKLRPLDYLKQTRLIIDAQHGDVNALRTVWEHNYRLVLSVANTLHIPDSLMADVLQEGAIGIHRAILKFEVDRWGELSTYAWHWIRMRMRRCLQRQRFRIAVPSHLHAPFISMRMEEERLLTQSEWHDWWCARMKRDRGRFRRLRRMQMLQTAISLRRTLVCRKKVESAELVVSRNELQRIVQEAFRKLTVQEREIVSLRYGIDGAMPLTLEEVGHRMNLTRERIRQIQNRAEARLLRIFFRLDIAQLWGVSIESRIRRACLKGEFARARKLARRHLKQLRSADALGLPTARDDGEPRRRRRLRKLPLPSEVQPMAPSGSASLEIRTEMTNG
jgi:RNA polymerase sigma factor (sigma-70 family)